jgi:sec-independent protein translocase protein TatA
MHAKPYVIGAKVEISFFGGVWMFGGLSPFHWLIILFIVFLLFGNRLPSVMRSLGQGVVEFKKGMAQIKDESDEDSSKKSSEKSEK